jgi:DNA-directed RNA polymerase specialized sigma24 family protein
MLIELGCMKARLAKLIDGLTQDPSLREDLMQEALVHLWLLEEQRPGQKPSWYMQSCKFRLQHYLAAGRSVDSGKRRGRQVALKPEDDDSGVEFGLWESENAVLGLVAAREIVMLLHGHLSLREQSVLSGLTEGMAVREIATQLRVSHPTVLKDRQRIAQLASRFGVAALGPPPARRGETAHRANGAERK